MEKLNYILGINDSHDASACLLKNGNIVVAIGEERVQRVKGTGGFPHMAINECLKFANIKSSDIDLVAFGSKRIVPDNVWNMPATLSIKDHIELQEKYYVPRILQNKKVKLKNVFPNYFPVSNLSYPFHTIKFATTNEVGYEYLDEINIMRINHTERILGIDKKEIKFFDHHQCHAKYAYYHSGFKNEDVVIVTADSGGDNCYSTVTTVINGEFKEIHRARNNILGKIYSSVTLLLGMRPDEHEYKVMGLAPYASEHQKIGPREIFNNSLSVEGLDFVRDPEMTDYYDYFKNKLRGYRFDGIAGGLQDFIELKLVQWFKNINNVTGINNFCYSGGLSNNIKSNKIISENDFVDSFFVPAGPGDENLSIGAAYIATEEYSKLNPIVSNINNAYFGNDITEQDITDFEDSEFIKNNYKKTKVSKNFLEIAKILSEGNIIAVCYGRMEFGSRALGHRSLIADPSNESVLRKINELIKKRDFWMPFTPSIIDHQYDNYVFNKKNIPSSFMTMSFNTKPEGKKA